MNRLRASWTASLLLLSYVAAIVTVVAAALGPDPRHSGDEALVTIAALSPSILLGVAILARRPQSPAGPALLALGTFPSLVTIVEFWGETAYTTHAWPAATVAAHFAPGVWVFHLAGFVWLCLVFPNGRLPGRVWSALPWLFVLAAGACEAAISLNPAQYASGGGSLPGTPPLELPRRVSDGLAAMTTILLLPILGACVASLVVRYRQGEEQTRFQLRWLMFGAGAVPVLLAAGWVAQAFHAPVPIAYAPFLLALLLFVPGAVAFAVLRHDLLDIDRLIGSSIAWVTTAAVAAGLFALLTAAVASWDVGVDLAPDSRAAIATAAFVTALLLLPVHRWLYRLTGRVFDRERTVMTVSVQRFVRRVRDGEQEPEDVQDVLRTSLDDPMLEVLLKAPGETGYIGLDGVEHETLPPQGVIELTARDAAIGAILLGRLSARRLRRARELVVEARLPIEVSRLRMELRAALTDVKASQSRLVQEVAAERRRLERDLHDGAQQRVVAVGMRLRSIQRQNGLDTVIQEDLNAAVEALEATVAELRRLAHGVRPSRLDDGLQAAIHDLVRGSTIPIDVRVGEVSMPEAISTTAYFVVAEALANTMKHAQATKASVTIGANGNRFRVEVIDDGRGGAEAGFGLTALRDRVRALGGDFDVISPVGGGTLLRAEI